MVLLIGLNKKLQGVSLMTKYVKNKFKFFTDLIILLKIKIWIKKIGLKVDGLINIPNAQSVKQLKADILLRVFVKNVTTPTQVANSTIYYIIKITEKDNLNLVRLGIEKIRKKTIKKPKLDTKKQKRVFFVTMVKCAPVVRRLT